jgi:hypothetical protein
MHQTTLDMSWYCMAEWGTFPPDVLRKWDAIAGVENPMSAALSETKSQQHQFLLISLLKR